ncbi:hypothetical protein E1B28_011832, partial [Marasmius oreades]
MHPSELQSPPRYNTSPLLQESRQAYDDNYQLSFQEQAPPTGTLTYPPGRQSFTASLGSFRVAPPQLSVETLPLASETQDLPDPPILGIDISVPAVESIFRETYSIPNTIPVHINSIPDPPPPSFTYVALTQIAIWSSQERRLTLADIYYVLGNRFTHLRNPDTITRWKGNIRHLLSLKKCFVKSSHKQGGRHYWTLDYRYLKGGDKRERKRGRNARGSDPVESEDVDEQDPTSKDDSSPSSSPSSTYSLNRTASTSTAPSSASSTMDIRSDPNYSLHTRSLLPCPSSYSVTGGSQTFSPGPVESYDPSIYQSHPHQSRHPQSYHPASATPSYSNAFGPSQFLT